VRSFPGHGALSRHDAADLDVGHRVEPAAYKRDPHDFVLWKPSDEAQPGWESPYGRGRPGWHIECSAMARSLLGATLDIHAGGGDLRFPHHECEHSQSEAANGVPLARTWLHNGMLLVNGRKMAKSDGNFVTVREMLDAGARGPAIRLALLRTHYRAPLDWQDSHVEAARTVARWEEALAGHPDAVPEANAHGLAVLAPLLDDLNTHGAVTAMHALAKALPSSGPEDGPGLAAGLLFGAAMLGIELGRASAEPGLPPGAQALLDLRAAARAERDYARSDRLRDELAALGVSVKDGREGQAWTLS
jgi:cysteinyl-tRNA synthetase